MQFYRSFAHGWPAMLVLAVYSALAVLGCQESPKIVSYVSPPDANLEAGPAAESPTARTLAAAVYRPDATWFFKLMGEPEAVAKQQKAFDALLATLKINGANIEWKLPEGWTETKGQGLRFATIKPSTDSGLEIAVNRFEGVAGSLLANVNRWRGELGLEDLKEVDLAKAVTDQKVGELTIQSVDLTGKRKARQGMGGMGIPGMGTGGMPGMPPAMGRNPPPVGQPGQVTSGAKEASDKLAFKLPKGWRESDKTVMFASKVLEVDGAPTVKVTISPLKPDGNSVADNVNRWRGQLALTPENPSTLEQNLTKEKTANGGEALLVDISGKGPMGPQRLLGAIAKRPEALWFVKLTGDPSEVAKVRDGFTEFVRTLKFD